MSEDRARALLRELTDGMISERVPIGDRTNAAFVAARAYLAAVPAPPAGRPPREPTDAMFRAAGATEFTLDPRTAGIVWRTMYDAAPAAEPAQPCAHDWRDRRSHDDPYALDTCCKCGAVRGEDEPVAQQPPPRAVDTGCAAVVKNKHSCWSHRCRGTPTFLMYDGLHYCRKHGGKPAAPQPEAPTLELITDLRDGRNRDPVDMVELMDEAAARIESDAALLAASRERERVERGDRLWQECENLRIALRDTTTALRDAVTWVDHAPDPDWEDAMRVFRAAIRKAEAALATPPDSAASPTE